MELIIIRHAHSEANANLTEDLDSKITDRGYKQAFKLSQCLSLCDCSLGDPPAIGIVSPYLRALETATEILTYTNIEFEVNGGVREYHKDKTKPPLPEDGGMTLPNRKKEFKFFSWDNISSFNSTSMFYLNETLEEFVERIKLFVDNLERRDKNGRFLIVSHGAPVRIMHDYATGQDLNLLMDIYKEQVSKGKPIENFDIKGGLRNCSITHIIDGDCKLFASCEYEKFQPMDKDQGSPGSQTQG